MLSEEQREKKENEHSHRRMWGTTKCTNIHVMGVLEYEEREKEAEKKIWEDIMAENFKI